MLGHANWIGILMEDKEKESLPIVESWNVMENSGVNMVSQGRCCFLGVLTIRAASAL